jgi:DNA-3-methyladenine glycosylase I
VTGEDGLARCPWAVTHPLNLVYHDTEWGVPVHGEQGLFERISPARAGSPSSDRPPPTP